MSIKERFESIFGLPYNISVLKVLKKGLQYVTALDSGLKEGENCSISDSDLYDEIGICSNIFYDNKGKTPS